MFHYLQQFDSLIAMLVSCVDDVSAQVSQDSSASGFDELSLVKMSLVYVTSMQYYEHQ